MKRAFTLILILLTGISVLYAIYTNTRTNLKSDLEKIIPKVSNSRQVANQERREEYVFVPYWSYDRNIVTDSLYSLIYFGVGVNEKGIDRSEPGYRKLENFITLTPNAKDHILAIRMVDASVNSAVLKDRNVQERIVNESIDLAKEYGFSTILLDFETSAFAFDSTISNITNFYTLFSENIKRADLKFYATLFGDNYFRSRAYDAKKIGELSDKVFVMTYDFHKSRGNPGPNFPLIDNKNYGYDLSRMVDDFQKDIDNRKLVIVLGYFGYDWSVGKDRKATSNGVPLSTNEIKGDFIDECEFKNCSFARDQQTNEPSISYVDDANANHVIWFEDQESINKKIEFLKSKGILEIGYWAYSYY